MPQFGIKKPDNNGERILGMEKLKKKEVFFGILSSQKLAWMESILKG